MKRPLKGFTLIEMLISLSIFGVITGIVIANFRAGQQGDELRISGQLVASTMRRAQTAALGGEEINYCKGGTDNLEVCLSGDDADCAGGVCDPDIPRGYGIHFTTADDGKRMMTYFADTDGDRIFDETEIVSQRAVSSGEFIEISSLVPLSGNRLDIVFVPPKPTVYFNGTTVDALAKVTLRHITTGAFREVMINRISGQINAD